MLLLFVSPVFSHQRLENDSRENTERIAKYCLYVYICGNKQHDSESFLSSDVHGTGAVLILFYFSMHIRCAWRTRYFHSTVFAACRMEIFHYTEAIPKSHTINEYTEYRLNVSRYGIKPNEYA